MTCFFGLKLVGGCKTARQKETVDGLVFLKCDVMFYTQHNGSAVSRGAGM